MAHKALMTSLVLHIIDSHNPVFIDGHTIINRCVRYVSVWRWILNGLE